MSRKITIKKGLDIKIGGGLQPSSPTVEARPQSVAVIPDDFWGIIPKPEVQEGDKVVAGQPLLFDKRDNEIKIVSPVGGTVKAIVRGERRKILRIVVEPDGSAAPAAPKPSLQTAEEAALFVKRSGLWAMMRQRPYDIVPAPDSTPRDIFVTAIDSAPLAADIASFVADKGAALSAGVAVLKKLTKGNVYISRRYDSGFKDVAGAEMIDVEGPHPAGNVGVQIANIAPINKGETVWTLDITTLWRLGEAALTGTVPMDAFVAVTGSEVKEPKIVKTVVGADLKSILAGDVKEDDVHHRIISGNVLTGTSETADGYLRFPYRQVTVIPEGDDVNEFMGWASLSPKKISESRSFPGHFFGKIFNPDARLNGGRRAFIMSGEYDRYLPMDIMAEYLIKAIIGRDIDRMEQLGIYEIAPEDLALGEYADTSKLEAQKIVREGLDYLRKELE